MDIQEYAPLNVAILARPPLDKPKEEKTLDWLIIFSIFAGFYLYPLVVKFGAWFLLLCMFVATLFFLKAHTRKKYEKQQHGFLKAYPFPPLIEERVGRHYPHLSDKQLFLVMLGLRQYFILCNAANGESVSMPSRVVDAAWHELILLTRTYEEFCRNGIGRFLHHTPLEAMASAGTAEAGRRKAWLLACKWEGINPQSPSRLPFLFAIDTALEIPDGFKHVLDNTYASRESGVEDDDSGGCGCGGCGD